MQQVYSAYDVSNVWLVSEVGMAGQIPKALESPRVEIDGKSFDLVHAWINLHGAPR
jgi:hypothetical protein